MHAWISKIDEKYTLSTCEGFVRRGLSSIIQPSGRLNCDELPSCEELGLQKCPEFWAVLTKSCVWSWDEVCIRREGSPAMVRYCLCFGKGKTKSLWDCIFHLRLVSFYTSKPNIMPMIFRNYPYPSHLFTILCFLSFVICHSN